MNSIWKKRCVCGGLIVGMFVSGIWVETCDRTGVTACPMPRIELNHDHTQDPRSPSPIRQSYVLGTGTGTDVPPAIPPRQIFAQPQTPEYRGGMVIDMPPNTALALLALSRRLPVVVEGTWRPQFELPKDVAPKALPL